jgi:hypothetical protein
MKLRKSALFLVAIPLLVAPLLAQEGRRPQHNFRADLVGPSEVPLSLTAASGHLRLTINDDDTAIHFVLEYQGVETHIRFSHIHVGKPTDSGGVAVFFCGGGGQPAPCPEGSGTVEGDITSADVGRIQAQQLAAGDLATLISAIRAGETYANLHTDDSPGGEIRGQIRPARRGEDN